MNSHGEKMPIEVKRIYEAAEPGDGVRILIDRLWPRGLAREGAKLDAWLKEIAPSTELRKWFGHDPEKWPEFKRRYFEEMDGREHALQELLAMVRAGQVPLLYGARDEQHNHAVALREYLKKLL
jgi:uncharacterized protein YeaO (DUF488 family)